LLSRYVEEAALSDLSSVVIVLAGPWFRRALYRCYHCWRRQLDFRRPSSVAGDGPFIVQ